MSTPRPGSMEWTRCWFDRRFKRGAQVTVRGEHARITSTRSGRVAVRVWSTDERLVVAPYEVEFEPAGEPALV